MIGFDNIYDYVISMDDFSLNWRFTNEKYNQIAASDLNQMKPLNVEASMFLSQLISNRNPSNEIPFKNDIFNIVDQIDILDNNHSDVGTWLSKLGVSFECEVFLSWNSTDAIIVPWKILIKYFNDFYYSASDDLSVFDETLNWELLFFHENTVYFGANNKFKSAGVVIL